MLSDAISIDHWHAQVEARIQEHTTPEFVKTTREITESLTDAATAPYPLQDCSISDTIEAFLPMLIPETELLTDYLSEDTIVCLIEPQWQKREVAQMHERMQELSEKKLEESSFMVPPDHLLATAETLSTELEQYPGHFNIFSTTTEVTESKLTPLNFEMMPLALPAGNYQMIINHIKTWAKAGKRIHLFCETPPAIETRD